MQYIRKKIYKQLEISACMTEEHRTLLFVIILEISIHQISDTWRLVPQRRCSDEIPIQIQCQLNNRYWYQVFNLMLGEVLDFMPSVKLKNIST